MQRYSGPTARWPAWWPKCTTPTGSGTPTGAISFYDGTTLLAAPQTLVSGSASIATSLSGGIHSITAVYSGGPNYVGSTSAALPQVVVDFGITLASVGGTASAPGTGPVSGNQTVAPGQPISFGFLLQPIGGFGSFSVPVMLSATGLPPGATVSFDPQVVQLGSAAASFSMIIQTAPATAALHSPHPFGRALGGGSLALGLLLLPFSGRMRRSARRLRPLSLCIALLLSLAVIGGLTGCGSGSGFFGTPSQSYTVNVIGTINGAGGPLQHVASVTLNVQ